MDELENYSNLEKRWIKLLDTTEHLLAETGFNYINWMLAVNTGALLWFAGILDKFMINDKLVYKWWAILTLVCLLFSLFILYRVRVIFFKMNLELKKIRMDDSFKMNLENFFNTANMLPSNKVSGMADGFFLLGIISMISYIITYFIRFK